MEIIHDERPIARKQHRCEMCSRTIEPGERYRRQRNTDCGDIWTWKNCAHCDVLLDILCHIGYDHDYGVTYEDVGEWEPETIAEARLKVYWLHRWRRRDGSLREIPQQPVRNAA